MTAVMGMMTGMVVVLVTLMELLVAHPACHTSRLVPAAGAECYWCRLVALARPEW